MSAGPPRGAALPWRGFLADPVVASLVFTLVVSLFFLLFPQVDLAVSRAFYVPGEGFPAAKVPAFQALRTVSDGLLWLTGLAVLVSLVAKLAEPDRPSLIPPSVSLFLLGTLALGPGLVVNGIFKSFWGRPRPNAVDVFGGSVPYVDVWHISDYCQRNCSFVSGEASSAIWLVAVALVVPRRWRDPALAVAIVLTLVFSFNRVAFGGHFLSDVLISWGLTAAVIAALYRFLIASPPPDLADAVLEAKLTAAARRLHHR